MPEHGIAGNTVLQAHNFTNCANCAKIRKSPKLSKMAKFCKFCKLRFPPYPASEQLGMSSRCDPTATPPLPEMEYGIIGLGFPAMGTENLRGQVPQAAWGELQMHGA